MTTRKPARKAPPEPRKAALSSWSVRWHALLSFLIACGVYANTLGNGFVTDDRLQLLKNPLVTSFHHIPALFSRSVNGFMGATDNYYRPVHLLAYMLLYSVAGFNPLAYHFLMVLLHGLTSVLVYLLVRRMARPAAAAFAASALFAVHPIHTEVVNWVAAVPDALVTPVVVLAFWLFLRQNASPSGLQIFAHSGLYLAAMLTKEPGVMLLPLYVGYERLCLGRGLREMRRNAPLYSGMLGALMVYLGCRFAALGSLAPAQQRFYHLTAPEFCLSAIVLAAEYIGKLILPAPLTYYYPFDPVRAITPLFLLALLVLAALAALLFRWKGRRVCDPADVPAPALVAFGIFWIAITLAPALNVTGVGRSVFSERYLYLPSVGFVCIAGLAWSWWQTRAPRPALVAGCCVLAVFAVQVAARNRDWRDNITLLETSIRQSPTGPELHSDLSGSYAERGDRDRAVSEARIAIRLDPANPTFRLNLGNLLLDRNPAESVQICQELVRERPSSSDAHYCLGLAWGASGNTPQAQAELEKTLALKPDYTYAMLVLAGIYGGEGRNPEAIQLCLSAAALRPNAPEPRMKMAALYLSSRQYPEAVLAARQALALDPDSDQAYLAHFYLGLAFLQSGSPQSALPEFASSLRLNPNFQQARDAYQQALTAAGGAK
ncbi:MAG TPA: tetratricopeptide repeat protein [Bryobacteraceae bacterium]|nr:tetratricopeptide repeat protein [Bryobacteraceae bacterium]